MRLFACVLALTVAAGPALAAEKLVPANATGALEAHRGKPWSEALFTCAGFQTYHTRRLKAAGDPAGAWTAVGKAVDLKNAGIAQLAKDNGMAVEAATPRGTARVDGYAFAVEAEDYGEGDFLSGWNKACDEIWAGYRKAGG